MNSKNFVRVIKKKLISPPGLLGYTYTVQEAHAAKAKNRLLAMRVETSSACNFKCIYCNGASGKKSSKEISLAIIKKAIAEFQDFGGRSVVVIGGGEPTIYPQFKALIRYISSKSMIPVVITNASRLNKPMARFLYQQNASVLFKLDSLKADIQDRLAGHQGAYNSIMQGLDNLFSSGFAYSADGRLRLGASFVVTKLNYREIPLLWKFCRQHNIYPNFEELILRGRGLLWAKELYVPSEKIRTLKEQLLKFDRDEYGFNWLAYTPLPGHGCLQHLYSVYLASDGYLRPCADVVIKLFNIRNTRLSEVIKSPFFSFIRRVDKYLQGKCRSCRHGKECVGCRGNAFNVGIREGKDIYQAFSREDPSCWNKNKKVRLDGVRF